MRLFITVVGIWNQIFIFQKILRLHKIYLIDSFNVQKMYRCLIVIKY